MQVNGTPMEEQDGMQLLGSNGEALRLEIKAGEKGAHFMLIEMARDEHLSEL